MYNISVGSVRELRCYKKQVINEREDNFLFSLFLFAKKGGKSYGRKEEDVYFYSRDGKSIGDWINISLQTCE